MTRLFINLLGPFQVTLDGKPARGFEYDKVRALLVYLAVEAGRPHRREALAGLLWPEQLEKTARNSLRTALSKLRQASGDRTAEPPFLHISRETIQFNREADYQLDVTEFSALLTACDRHPHRRLDTCRACAERQEAAAALYRGDFLAGFSLADSAPFEEWLAARREQWHRQALNAFYNLATYCERRGEYGRAYQYAARQVVLEPWREEAHRQAMRALAFDGQRSAALAQYERCREILAAELEVPPTPETTFLYERIRSDSLGNSPADRRIVGTVPELMTSLVGREKELTAVTDMVLDPACRLLTLTGLGGMGKTRLVQEATLRLELDFPHGAAFVPLGLLSSKQDVVSAVAEVLDFQLQGGRSEQVQLLAFLREKELLLVLDNFEQFLPGADLLIELMRGAPGLVLLVTSRERLNLQAEWVFDLSGLDYPVAESALEEMERYSAVQLFVQRARQVEQGFSMSAADASAVAHICRLCQGMPLAIELAAATVRYQSCSQIAGQLQNNWQALTATYGDLPERHQSVHASFEHSWALLSAQERGDRWSSLYPQANLAEIVLAQGAFSEAKARLEETLALARELGDKQITAGIHNNLGQIALKEDRLSQATSLFEQALTTSQELGSANGIAESHTTLGDVAARRGAFEQAALAYQEAVRYYRQATYQAGILTCLERLAELAWLRSESPQAARWFAVAEAGRQRLNLPRTPVEQQRYERRLKTMQEQLEEAAFARLWAARATNSLDQALDEALKESLG